MPSIGEIRWNWILLRYVRPFYMKASWVPDDSALRRRIQEAGRRVELRDVRQMLREGWRGSSVASWYCLRFPADAVMDDLELAMREAHSTKSAPLLAVACVALMGTRALTILESAPCVTDTQPDDAAVRGVAAAIEEVGGTPPVAIDDTDRARFRGLLRTAHEMQVAYRGARPI